MVPFSKSGAVYITPHMTPEELNKTYEKFPAKHWGGYLGPCYKRKKASSLAPLIFRLPPKNIENRKQFFIKS